jgi:phosphatidylserine/phosphatidylglycerophosphate/cardiolipin synthase-like enzyme
MLKLIEAQKRGVNCVLMIDDLNNWVDWNLRKEFEESGGLFYSLNPIKYFWNIFTKEFFRRHHEKITVIDDTSIIGSSNIADDYGSFLFNK